jgi:hypothetical protein
MAEAIFYVSPTGFLSYFGISGRIPKLFTTPLEASSPPDQTAITGRFSCLTPCMAIV